MNKHVQCECGGLKDHRAKKCSTCAGSGFGIGFADGKISKSEILKMVPLVTTIQELADHFGVKRDTVYRAIRRHRADITHFTRTTEGLKSRPERYLTSGVRVRYAVVRRLVLKEKLLEEICQECGLESTWNGKPIVLELDHRDGNPTNNSLDNLRFLCPNCHSQEPTSKGKKRT